MENRLEEIFIKYDIKGISFDSRKINKSYAFFAIKGENFDGNNYINEAFNNGASIVFTDNKSKQSNNIIYVQDIRMTLGIASSIFYPHGIKNLIAVTGTNGKSSVVSYINQILSFLGKKTASIGTLGIDSTEKLALSDLSKNDNLTSSDPISFYKNLHILSKAGIENIAFEASSHGISQKRFGNIQLNGAAFTSFSQDHLDYHKTMQNYLSTKLDLFENNLLPKGEVVLNSDMQHIEKIQKFLSEKNTSYSSVGRNGSIKIISVMRTNMKQEISCQFKGNIYKFHTNIIGSFQANNLLIATRLVHNMGVDFDKIIKILPNLKSVCGRLDRITNIKSPFHVFVDYAHTPDALENTLIELQKIKEKTGHLYVLFGCGGERDKSKRPIMGKIASENADYVVITDDNPRDENPKKIRNEIISGANHKLEEIPDRKKAITNIISRLKQNDILLIAGKGHENYQIIGKKMIEFSDIKIVHQILSC